MIKGARKLFLEKSCTPNTFIWVNAMDMFLFIKFFKLGVRLTLYTFTIMKKKNSIGELSFEKFVVNSRIFGNSFMGKW